MKKKMKMMKSWPMRFSYVAILMLILCSKCGAVDADDRKVYIVYLGSHSHHSTISPLSYHNNMLQQVLEEDYSVSDSLVTSYSRNINGFAARLADKERDRLARMNGVVSVFPSKTLHPKTTRSWDFIGFHETIKRNLALEKDIIIGVLDSGVWPESESFKDDEGLGPPPEKWKGTCNGGKNFTCNNKIIGARFYPKPTFGNESARDETGHGSHTASTIAGNRVKNASFYGIAQGVARGGVSSARIAVYKVCYSFGCRESDILAAFDDAISDGVDLISVSLGSVSIEDFIDDAVAIGAFHTMTKGILTIQAAGNSGPARGTTVSIAPWVLSVAASTTDRRIVDKIILGDGKSITGYSVNSFSLNDTKFPMILGSEARNSSCTGGLCEEGCLDHNLAKGKIVLCQTILEVSEAYRAGAVGLVGNSQYSNVSFVVPIPALALEVKESGILDSYMSNSTEIHMGEILKSEAVNDTNAPLAAEFSSRGPNIIIPEIMKPDISAPGVDILAAYPPNISPSDDPSDTRSVNYNIISGTSMACPHVAAAAAYVKTFHPDWSPSAIKSALMTTAWPMNGTENIVQEFASGSGHVNPIQATNPGLLYELEKDDYIKLLCSLGYDTQKLRLISGDNKTSCPAEGSNKLLAKDSNYPAMAVQVLPVQSFNVSFHRTVTNVGTANSTYKVNVLPNSLMNVTVEPEVLSFKALNEKKSFVATIFGGEIRAETMFSTSLVWSDGTHSVRIPIVVYVISITS